MKLKKLLSVFAVFTFGVLLLAKPQISQSAVANAIVLSGRILIPSLFPFCFCVLFITDSIRIKNNGIFSKFTYKIFGLPPNLFFITVLSMLGGYPIGAKLLNDAVTRGEISPKDSGKMLCFCVNAGPGFIIAAVGNGILRSQTLGFILLTAHCISSFAVCFFMHIITKYKYPAANRKSNCVSLADRFVYSATGSANTMLNIIAFVILFAVIVAYAEHYSNQFEPLKLFVYLAEVTIAVTKTSNIYLISALLGFAGICIWCQIISIGKNLKINLPIFIIFRLVHALISTTLTALLVKIFAPVVATFSDGNKFDYSPTVSGAAVSISLLMMVIIFGISLFNRQNNTNLLEDMI